MTNIPSSRESITKLGLRSNWRQVSLPVIVNAFVGGMTGFERTIIPWLSEVGFGMAAP
ncbi:MAG: hypothetical protein AB7K37_11060 [Cyclobacteriaceae bacterium]